MRLVPLLLVLAVAPLSAQVRGVELYQLLGKEIPAKTTGTTRLPWLPGGGYLESAPDSVRGGRAFFRVDPTGKRVPLFDDKTVTRIISEYTRLSGKETRGLPFTIFTWESNNSAIGFSAGGNRYAYQLAGGTLLKLGLPAKTGPFDIGQDGAAGAFSPDFTRYAFVRDYDNLWVFDVASGKEELIGKGTSEDNTIGFLNAGQWFTWSPDSRRIAYLKASQSGTKTPALHGLTKPSSIEYFRYPYTTDSTARMEVWVADLDSKQQVKLTTSTVENPWIREITWLPGGKEVAWQVLGQWQDRLELNAGDATTGANRQLMLDRDTAFMTDEHSFRLLADGKRFLWLSERTGWRHIYLYDHVAGKLVKPLTSGEWEVEQIEGVDESGGWVYFTAAANLGLDRQLFRVKLDGTGLTKLTSEDGVHSISMDATAHWFVDDYSSIASPRTVSLRSADGKLVRILATTSLDRVKELGLETPELMMVKGADGVTDISGIVFKPAGFDPAKKYPMIVYVYGGPHVKSVHNSFETIDSRARWAQLGFIVAEFDARGTPGRGKAFNAGNFLQLGQTDVDDQAAAARALSRLKPWIDSTRVGVTGISHGGYLTLMMVLRYPDVYQVGVATAPLTDLGNGPRQYTGWNMRTPASNPDGYAKANPVALAATLRSRLLIQHGTNDRNAVLGNTLQFARKAIDAGRPLDMMIYPEGDHVFVGKDAAHGLKGMLGYFLEHLQPEGWDHSLAVLWQ